MIMMFFKLKIHDACHFYNQVITKLKLYYTACSPCVDLKTLKRRFSCYVQDVLALIVEDFVYPHRLLIEHALRVMYTMMRIFYEVR